MNECLVFKSPESSMGLYPGEKKFLQNFVKSKDCYINHVSLRFSLKKKILMNIKMIIHFFLFFLVQVQIDGNSVNDAVMCLRLRQEVRISKKKAVYKVFP